MSESDSPQPVERTPAEPSTPGEGTRQTACTLTAAEREAIRYFAVIDGPQYLPAANAAATTLRVLLERTK